VNVQSSWVKLVGGGDGRCVPTRVPDTTTTTSASDAIRHKRTTSSSYHRQGVVGIRIFAFVTAAFVLAGCGRPAAVQKANRVDLIRERGVFTCGVWPEVRGFATVDANGSYAGFDVDICRAVATAILGSPERTRFARVRTVPEFLAAPGVDVVSRRLTWMLSRERPAGLRFGPVTFHDGQTFLVPKQLRVSRLNELAGRPICMESGSPAEFNLGPLFRARRLALEEVHLQPGDDLATAFAERRCDAYTSDQTMLGSIRAGFARPDEFLIFPELVSKEPLAQVLRNEDEHLYDILQWTVFALVNAEELGITASNAEQMLSSDDYDVRRLLGVEPGNGAVLGLSERWAYDVVRAVGNYGEIFERHVGPRTPIGLPRGLNRLSRDGGLMWAPPVR
jgi:general L-amino acid transport system substrate-binding protein